MYGDTCKPQCTGFLLISDKLFRRAFGNQSSEVKSSSPFFFESERLSEGFAGVRTTLLLSSLPAFSSLARLNDISLASGRKASRNSFVFICELIVSDFSLCWRASFTSTPGCLLTVPSFSAQCFGRRRKVRLSYSISDDVRTRGQHVVFLVLLIIGILIRNLSTLFVFTELIYLIAALSYIILRSRWRGSYLLTLTTFTTVEFSSLFSHFIYFICNFYVIANLILTGDVFTGCCSIDFYSCFLSAFWQEFVCNCALQSVLVT